MERGGEILISVVACTCRSDFIQNLVDNFKSQSLEKKELILILNSSSMTLDQEILKGINFKVLRFPEEVSLGECLNKGVSAARYDIVAKMDDDDYYGPEYLEEAYEVLGKTGADLVGKSSFYIYFKKRQELRLYDMKYENNWIIPPIPAFPKAAVYLHGATLVFKKNLFHHLAFPLVNLGEDTGFQQLCFQHQMKIYSLSRKHFAYIRYDGKHHTSDVKESILRGKSKFVATGSFIEDIMEKEGRQ